MPHQRRCRHHGGFSLPELTIVVLIIGILAAAGIPRYADSITRFRADAAAKRIAADLMYVRQIAMNQGASKQVTFNISGNRYSMPAVPDPNRSALTYSVKLSSTAYPATITAANFGGTANVTFDRFGQPNATGYVTVTSGSYQETINLDAVTGRVTIQ